MGCSVAHALTVYQRPGKNPRGRNKNFPALGTWFVPQMPGKAKRPAILAGLLESGRMRIFIGAVFRRLGSAFSPGRAVSSLLRPPFFLQASQAWQPVSFRLHTSTNWVCAPRAWSFSSKRRRALWVFPVCRGLPLRIRMFMLRSPFLFSVPAWLSQMPLPEDFFSNRTRRPKKSKTM